MSSADISAYAQAAASGKYDRVTGLRGKYDNVRIYWEDQSLRLLLQPHLRPLVDRRARQGRGVRIADLGCGSGDGFETLMSINRGDARPQDHDAALITPDRLEAYIGLELNPALLEQARDRHRREKNARFVQADLREGLPFAAGERPCDVYFASFGTLSHLGEDDTVKLFTQIAHHAEDGALIMADWLGRYAYEWVALWDADCSQEKWMDYRISYIYPKEERDKRDIDSFSLRLLAAEEARRAFRRVEKDTGIALTERELFDRSMFVGRHMETGDYNPHAVPLRSAINRLHEPLCRTNLGDLLFDLHIPQEFSAPAETLESVHAAWDATVRYVMEALTGNDKDPTPLPEIPASTPSSARRAIGRLGKAIQSMPWVEADDPRAQWIEPQLGLALRNIELQEQRGRGCGHGLVAVYEIKKG